MRIIAGSLKGKRLARVRSDIRPTPERLRESLFSILGEGVRGSVWLDLFSGSGVIGIEALSRGAKHVIFNDRAPESRKLIRENLRRCGVNEGYEVHGLDAFQLLRNSRKHSIGDSADYLFLDPPFRFGRYRKLLERITEAPLCGHRTLIMLELFRKTHVDFVPSDLELIRTVKIGDSHLLLMRFSKG